MEVEVLSVTLKENGVRVAWCRCGKLYGEMVASPKVMGPGNGVVKVTGVVREGRYVFKGVVHPA